jgi:hypothetical protein
MASTRIRNGVGQLADFPPLILHEGKLTEQHAAYITGSLRAVIRQLNGLISFGNGDQSTQSGNIDGQTKEYVFTLANTAYILPHGLKRVPIGIITLDVNTNGAVVRGINRGSWSNDTLQLSCSVAATTALFVIL